MMYEQNYQSASRRAGDDFLRRMLSGELNERSLPVQIRAHGNPSPAESGACAEKSGGCARLDERRGSACPYPQNAAMPSLAMVYSPDQAWRCLYDVTSALHKGTLFQELDKPFEGRSVFHRSH